MDSSNFAARYLPQPETSERNSATDARSIVLPTSDRGNGAATPEPPGFRVPDTPVAIAEDDSTETPDVGPGYDPAAAAQRWTPSADTTVTAAPDYIRVDEVVRTRRLPAEIGWRKTVYHLTGHAVNLGAGPAERRMRDYIAAIKANIPGNYQLAAVSIKGGVGKTRIVAGVGTAMRRFRKEPVLAIDANPTYGGLGRLIDPNAALGIREFLADDAMTGYTRARKYTGLNPEGLEVLAGNQNTSNPLALDAEVFAAILGRTRKFYQLALIDCGDAIEHPVMAGVLCAADALMIVGSANIDGGLSAEQTIEWLAARNGHELLKRSVLVLNDVHRCASRKFVSHMTEKLGPRVGAVKTIPWDPHLRDAATFDWEALQKSTRWALIELAAELATGFPTAGALAR
jgi:MinD-like ATPase involved in chromosome partitioning or flagellar assembly